MEKENKLIEIIEKMAINQLEEFTPLINDTEEPKPQQTTYLETLYHNNKKNYKILVETFEKMQNDNSPNIKKIQSLNKLITHIEKYIEIKKHSLYKVDIDFCTALFHLKNDIILYQLDLDGVENFIKVSDEKSNTIEDIDTHHEYYRPKYSNKVILFIMNALKNEGLMLNDLTKVDMAKLLHEMTGRSHHQLRIGLSAINTTEFSEADKSEIKSILEKISKAVDMLLSKKK